jgi:predicted Zn-dependent protease
VSDPSVHPLPSTPPPESAGAGLLDAREARHILDEALAVSEAEDTEALFESRVENLTRFANNEIHQNVTARDHTLLVRARIGLRSGAARTNRLDSNALREVADRALSLARLSPEDPDLPEPGGPMEIPALDAYVPATAACTPESRADRVGSIVSRTAAHGLEAAGALTTAATARAYANTRGRFAFHTGTHAGFTCTARGEGGSGWVGRHRRDVDDLDVERLGAIAIEKAERARGPVAFEPGPMTVVLEPAVVAELLLFLTVLGFGAQAEQEGRSFMAGRMGQRITGERVTLMDDPYDPRAFGCPFDYEGTPPQRVMLIENGIARAVVHDRRTGHRAGVSSTGHASPPPAVEGPLPFSLVMSTGESSVDEMVASTERGVLVTRFWYNRVVDARRTLITGMTRDGTFLIENGRVTHPLRNLRYNDAVLDVLARADLIGRDAEPAVFDYTGTCVVAPALRVRDFHFTGASPS